MSNYVKLSLEAGTILRASHMDYVENGIVKAHDELTQHIINHPSGGGKGLEFHWDGTNLGIRQEGEPSFVYVNLKGQDAKEIEIRSNDAMLQWRYNGDEDWINLIALDEIYYHPDTHPAAMITGLSAVATSGSYLDLKDRPELGDIGTGIPSKDYIDQELAKKANLEHFHSKQNINDFEHQHTKEDIYDLDVYSKSETNQLIDDINIGIEELMTEAVLSEVINESEELPDIETDSELDLINISKRIWVQSLEIGSNVITGCVDHMQFNEKAIQILYPWNINIKNIYRRIREFGAWSQWEAIGGVTNPANIAVCGTFTCGELTAGEGTTKTTMENGVKQEYVTEEVVTTEQITIPSALSNKFKEKLKKNE